MRWGRPTGYRVRLALAAALILLTLPAGADAKPGYKVYPGGTEVIVPVKNKGVNYVISASANDRQRVEFEVERPSWTISYSTQGYVSARRIKADFGALGRIDIRLRPVRYDSDPDRKGRCKGRGPIYTLGRYQGTIEFTQAAGVPKILSKRGRAYVDRRFRQVCKRRRPKPRPDLYPELKRGIEEALLTVRGKGDGRTIRLEAAIYAIRRNPARSGGTFNIAVHERHEGVRITRRMGKSFNNLFAMSKRNKAPETVTVELPKPFAGHALYSRARGTPASWTGDLSVDFPGASGIPLTGEGFSADLCRGRVDSCLPW